MSPIGDNVYLSIVIPAYNEERRILPTLEQVSAFLAQQGYVSEIIVVDDGSVDQTAAVVKGFIASHPNVHTVSTPHRGKGHAVKTGMLLAQGEYRFLCDADLSMPINLLPHFFPPTQDGYDVVIGSREAPGAHRYDESAFRHFIGRIFNLITQLVAVPGILDTQCGFKLFRAPVAEVLFSLQTLDGFGFDVEILFLARKRGYRILELPIDWYHMTNSKVRPVHDSIRVFRETMTVRLNHWRGRYAR